MLDIRVLCNHVSVITNCDDVILAKYLLNLTSSLLNNKSMDKMFF